jgi:exonuclease-1
LERIGSVHGVITEDSDLLVFGCRTVLFKLDAVTSTVACILRSDFGSITSAESGISLSGWSDVQFRAMAILSGCDYLPSIPGIGLKTAWSLLRKYRTPEKVIRAVKLEGKKDVPRDYLRDFKLAEKVFLHQRVYDPESQRIVNMTPIPQGDVWDENTEAFVGLCVSGAPRAY